MDPPGDSEETSDPHFEALWQRVTESWDDEKTHHAILEYAIQRQALPELAGRYRAAADDPEKAERAKKKLDGVVIAATQILYSMKTPASKGVPVGITLSAAGIVLVLLGWLAFAILGK